MDPKTKHFFITCAGFSLINILECHRSVASHRKYFNNCHKCVSPIGSQTPSRRACGKKKVSHYCFRVGGVTACWFQCEFQDTKQPRPYAYNQSCDDYNRVSHYHHTVCMNLPFTGFVTCLLRSKTYKLNHATLNVKLLCLFYEGASQINI